jgi:mannose-1-phosphate guanylyltransferase/phosphomannomutase
MSYLIELLAKHEFKEIDILLFHQPQIITNYFSDGQKYGVKLNYICADQDYGTAGAVKYACQGRAEPIIVISADLVTDFDLTAAVDFHQQRRAAATLVLTSHDNPLQFGIVITDQHGRINKFLEKPSWGEIFSDTINAGIYILEPAVIKQIPDGKKYDFSLDLFPRLLKKKAPLFGYIAAGYWRDIGKIEEYAQTNFEFLAKQTYLAGAGCQIAASAQLNKVILGRNCQIGPKAKLNECVVWDNCEIGQGAILNRTIICESVKIGAEVVVPEGGVIGSGTEIGAKATVQPFIKIWPRKIVEEGAIVSRSMIWRERWSKSVFGQYGVTGVCGVDITPQFAAALGAAYGTSLSKGARISCSRDSHKASRMIYRALVAGALSAGVNISNLEMLPIPVNRYGVKSLNSLGGFHVRKSPFDPEVIDIKFFDDHGLDLAPIAEKKIERIFFSENFSQTTIEESGELNYPSLRVIEEYEAGVFAQINKKAIAEANLKLVVDYSFGSTSQVFPTLLGDLGVEVIALDAYIDETKITKDQVTFEKSLQQMRSIVKSVKADLGVMLDTGGEKIFVCDEKGQLIAGRDALGVMALLAFKNRKGSKIAVPVVESRLVDELAKKYGGKVRRVKNTFREMMEVAQKNGLTLVGESNGGFIFPDCFPFFDGMLSICKLLEALAKQQVKLSQLVAELPPIVLLKTQLDCPHNLKGKLMRRAMAMATQADSHEMIDGIKFWHGNNWALILPDQILPQVHIYAEAESQTKARKLLDRYVRQVEKFKEA